jgi:hypothetical protein
MVMEKHSNGAHIRHLWHFRRAEAAAIAEQQFDVTSTGRNGIRIQGSLD